MEVILIKDMEKLGYANDIVNAKPGYEQLPGPRRVMAKAATASREEVLAEASASVPT